MGRFLCCWKCTNDQNGTTINEGESLRDEEEENNPKWLSSFHIENEKEHSKRAIAVAVATAAAADAAVAAAQAAVALVRLTSKRSDWHERYWAAVKIQSVFRASLARKALRALKALVKLQALIKGYLVRKQTFLALQSMQTLIRIQTTIQSKKSQPASFHRRSLETQQISSKSSSPRTINTSLPFSSPKPIQIPPDLSLPKCQNSRERSVTASNTPRFMANECNNPRCPNYMASTWSFDARVRSQSATKLQGRV